MLGATKIALKLQLATAQRKGEILGAEWSEIDFDMRWWLANNSFYDNYV
jgi:integrase